MSQNYFSGFGNNSMFGKHTESISSSDRTQRIKNKQIFMNRKNTRNATFYNNNTKDLAKINSYNDMYDLFKGFKRCKFENKTDINNQNCFNVWLNEDVDPMKKMTLDHWYISKIDFSVNPPSDPGILNQMSNYFFPYVSTNQKVPIFNHHSYFDENNTKGITVHAKHFKRGFPISKYS